MDRKAKQGIHYTSIEEGTWVIGTSGIDNVDC
jgi:hypothetical protein